MWRSVYANTMTTVYVYELRKPQFHEYKKKEPIICLKLFPAHYLNIKIGSFKPLPDILLELRFARLIKKGSKTNVNQW